MTNELWPGGPRFLETDGVFKLGTDSVLLAYFARSSPVKKTIRAADLGCGSGIISILLAWDNPGLLVDGVEINRKAVNSALENVKLCGLEQQITIVEGDLRKYRNLLVAGAYDITAANPPYYAAGSGKRSENTDTAVARGEEMCSLEEVCSAAGYITRWGGSFLLVHKPERLADVFRSLNTAGFEPKRLRFVQHKCESPPNLVLIESRRGGNPSLKIEPPLILSENNGSDSEEVKMIYHRA